MPLSAAAKRLVSLFRGIPADKKEEIGKAFDKKHAEALLKFEKEALANAALELKDVNFSSKKEDDKKKKKKKINDSVSNIIYNVLVEDTDYEQYTKTFLSKLSPEHRPTYINNEQLRLTRNLDKATAAENPSAVGIISAETGQRNQVQEKLDILSKIRKDLDSQK